MKKKLLSILVALIVCISPLFFAVGCSTDNDGNVSVTPLTGWKVLEGSSSFSASTVQAPNEFTLKYKVGTLVFEDDPSTTDVKENSYYTYAEKTITSLREAIEAGLGCAADFDSSEMKEGEKRKMILTFELQRFEVEYTVVASLDSTPQNPQQQPQS